MAITYTRQVVTTGTGATNLINNNFAAIETALEKELTRIRVGNKYRKIKS